MISPKTFIWTILILCLALSGVFVLSSRGVPVVIATNLENIPMHIGGFQGKEDYFPQGIYDELNADKHVYRHYRSPDGKQVDLYIGYYGTAKGGRSRHHPYACLPAAGWGIVEKKQEKLSPANYFGNVSVNYVLAQKDDTYNIMYHWYQSRGNKVLASGIQQNIERLLGRVLHNRNDGAFVSVTVISTQKSVANAKALGKSFAEEVLVFLPQYWPEEFEFDKERQIQPAGS